MRNIANWASRYFPSRPHCSCSCRWRNTAENLALTCVSCSLRKGARQSIKDSNTGELVFIFNPRLQLWQEHFAWSGVQVIGLTATGRVTVQALDLNRLTMLAIRAEEELLGRHPP